MTLIATRVEPPLKSNGELELDHRFLDELKARALPDTLVHPHARQASLAFLYLYMTLGAMASVRWVFWHH